MGEPAGEAEIPLGWGRSLLVLVLATPAMAESGNADPGLWEQFVAWIDARIGVPVDDANGDLTFDDWLVLMGRIGIPIG